jgi:hypothetical protein
MESEAQPSASSPLNKTDKEIKKPPILFSQTQRVIAQIEERLGGAFLAYWNAPGGSICQNDTVGFYELLQTIGRKPVIYQLIKSSGGNGQASLRIVHLLRQHTDRVVCLVPLECASAGTMLALGADEIRMGPLAYLTAIDTSLRHDLSPRDQDNRQVSVSQDELTRVVALWRQQGDENVYAELFKYVHPLVVGAVDRVSSLSVRLCREILAYHMQDDERAEEISRRLNSDYPSHNYPITLREAEKIGLKVCALDSEVNNLLVELNELYSEMGQIAVTDFDELNHHNNEILNILEGRNIQVYFQTDKDWHYRKEERRWVSMNDKSSWRKMEQIGDEVRSSIFHIR